MDAKSVLQSLHILNVCPLDYTTVRCFKVVLMKRKPHSSVDSSFHHRPVKKRRGEGLYLLPNPLNYGLYFATWTKLNKFCLNQREFSRGRGEDTKTRRKTLLISGLKFPVPSLIQKYDCLFSPLGSRSL